MEIRQWRRCLRLATSLLKDGVPKLALGTPAPLGEGKRAAGTEPQPLPRAEPEPPTAGMPSWESPEERRRGDEGVPAGRPRSEGPELPSRPHQNGAGDVGRGVNH